MLPRLLALAFVLVSTLTAGADDWPGWLGARRDGSTTEKVAPWKGELKVLWRKPVDEGHSSPVVAGGKVFLHTKVKSDAKDKFAERVEAFDAATGASAWKAEYDHVPFKSLFGNGPRGTPSVVDGKVYTFGITGVLSCYDAQKGDLVWQVDTLKTFDAKNLFFGASCSPIVVGDLVSVNVGGKGASIVAFEKNTGKTAWKALDDKASYSSPNLFQVGGVEQLVYLTAANLVALNPKDGKTIWTYPFKDALSESSTTPVRIGDLLFGSSITVGGVGLKLKSDSVEKAWMEPGLTCYFSTPVAVGKDLYLVTGTKPPALVTKATLRCIDPATGKESWKRDNVGKYHASLTRTGDDKLLLVEEGGSLVLLDADPKEYRELSRSKICGTTWAHPAVADGKLYIRDNRELLCVDLQSTK